jgi:hypothetical protein
MLEGSGSRRHLSRAAVLDVGRGIPPVPALDGTIRTHLEGCERCRLDVRAWKSLTDFARRWDEIQPPESAVRRARALVASPSPAPKTVSLRIVLQHFDAGVVLPAGARGGLLGDHDTYQVVYHAEEFSVDLRVSRTLSRRKVIVVGQIKHLAQPAQRLGSIPVLLTSKNRMAVRTLTNEWGEFSFEHEDQDQLWLEMAPEPGRSIRIPIKARPLAAPGLDR